LWGDLRVAAKNEFFHFRPVHRSQIQPQAHPAPGADIGGHVELAGIGLDQSLIVIGENLAAYANDAVPVMIVEVIRKNLSCDQEAGVISFVLAHRSRKSKANFG
jgi:hypothetical protein